MFAGKRSLTCLAVVLLELFICGYHPALGRHLRLGRHVRRPRHHHSSEPEYRHNPNDLSGNAIDEADRVAPNSDHPDPRHTHAGRHRQAQPEDFVFLPDKYPGRVAGEDVNDEREHLGDRRHGLIFDDGAAGAEERGPANPEYTATNEIDALKNGKEGLIFGTAGETGKSENAAQPPTTPVVDTRFIIDAPKRQCAKQGERMDSNGKCRAAL